MDAGKLTDSYTNLSRFFSEYLEKPAEPYREAICLSDGDTVELDELKFTVLHTPGHTSGSTCYVIGGVIFSGDTLFKNSIGRTDMPDGNQITLFESLKRLENFRGEYEDYRLLSGAARDNSRAGEKQQSVPERQYV